MTFKARNDIHLARRIWHFAGVLVIFGLYWILTEKQALLAAVAMAALLIGFDLSRLRVPFFNRLFTWMFQSVLRDSEKGKISGLSYLMAGTLVIVAVFPKVVGLLSILMLAVADPLASYFGIRFGKDKLVGDKSLQGTLAAFVACFVIALVYLLYMDLMRERLFIVCLLAGLIGAFSELVPIFKLDDNLVFPVVSATLLTGLFYVFGGL